MLDCARRFATQHVDGWIVVQAGNLGDALCAAGPKDVPLITVGAAPLACETAWVGADDAAPGNLVGGVLGRNARGRGCTDVRLVIVANSAADPVSAARVAGIEEAATPPVPTWRPRRSLLDAATQDRAYADFTTALSTIGADEQVLVGTVNDAAAQGVVAAIPDDRAGTVAVAGHRRRPTGPLRHSRPPSGGSATPPCSPIATARSWCPHCSTRWMARRCRPRCTWTPAS